MKVVIVIVALGLLVLLVIGELWYENISEDMVYRKEEVDSLIPGISKYYLYDRDGHKYKVKKEAFDCYQYWEFTVDDRHPYVNRCGGSYSK